MSSSGYIPSRSPSQLPPEETEVIRTDVQIITERLDAMPGTAIPKPDGVGSAGTAVKFSREDHVHPDQGGSSVEPGTAIPKPNGVGSAGIAEKFSREDHVHPDSGGSSGIVNISGWPNSNDDPFKFSTVAKIPLKKNLENYDRILISGFAYTGHSSGMISSFSIVYPYLPGNQLLSGMDVELLRINRDGISVSIEDPSVGDEPGLLTLYTSSGDGRYVCITGVYLMPKA